MSINVYLNGDEVVKHEGFSEINNHSAMFLGMKLCFGKGRYYFTLAEGDPIPEVFADLVDEISLRDTPTGVARRECGIYEHATAAAEVQCTSDKLPIIQITGKNMKDVAELLLLIKTGEIRPVKSFEGSQTGKSRIDLERDLEMANLELSALKSDHERLVESWRSSEARRLEIIKRIKTISQINWWNCLSIVRKQLAKYLASLC